ncbi:unnamed protein product [Prunus armeniaca]
MAIIATPFFFLSKILKLKSRLEEATRNVGPGLGYAVVWKWRTSYAPAIPDDVYIRLVKLVTDDVPGVDLNDPNSRIFTFRPFYFSLGFMSMLLKFFRMEFFYFFAVRRYKKYAQVHVCNAKLFDSFTQGDHLWHANVLEVSRKWEGESYGKKNISKKLVLEPNMAKTRDDQPAKLDESSIELSEKRKATPMSSKDKAASPQARDVSSLRKKLRLPYVVIKYSFKEVSFAKKT